MKKLLPIFLILLAFCLIYYLPIFIKPSVILNRGNDLEEFFWPILNFVKTHIIIDRAVPLWNNLFLSGNPLIPDPQAPIFYPINIISLFLPLNLFFLISFFLHSLIGLVGMYLCSREGFRFSKTTSVFLAALYLAQPKLAGYLEAGHVGLIASSTWIPFIILAVIKIAQKPNLKYSILYAVSLSLLFFSHLPTLIIVAASSVILFLFVNFYLSKSIFNKSLKYFIIAVILTFGLTAVSFLPQLGWQKESTRYLLLKTKDVYPKWNSIIEPFKIMFVPWLNSIDKLQKIDSEKWIAIGITPAILALIGFFILKTKSRVILFILSILIFLVIANNASPIYSLLLKQNWYLILRVSTRFLIIAIFIELFLIGKAFDYLFKRGVKFTSWLFFLAALAESLILGRLYLSKPTGQNPNMAPIEIYNYIAKDKSLFRVFCLTRCLSQKTASIYDLQLLDGYNTLQQRNFFQEAWQLTGTYWNYYTLSIPPIGSYIFDQLKPDAKSLGEYNVKYIISPHKLNGLNFSLKTNIDKYFIYENRLFLTRAYLKSNTTAQIIEAPVEIYKPNQILVKIPDDASTQLILSEVYSPGWKAYLNGKGESYVMETPIALRAVDIKKDTRSVLFVYRPVSYKLGKVISAITILIILIGVIFNKKVNNKIK